MTATAASQVSVSAPTHIGDWFAEFGDVRAVPVTGRIAVRGARLYDSRDAADLAADVRGALRWIEQHTALRGSVQSPVAEDGAAISTTAGVTTWKSGFTVDRSKSQFSGPTCPVATLAAPASGYTVDDAHQMLRDLAGVGAFLDAQTDAYEAELLNGWD